MKASWNTLEKTLLPTRIRIWVRMDKKDQRQLKIWLTILQMPISMLSRLMWTENKMKHRKWMIYHQAWRRKLILIRQQLKVSQYKVPLRDQFWSSKTWMRPRHRSLLILKLLQSLRGPLQIIQRLDQWLNSHSNNRELRTKVKLEIQLIITTTMGPQSPLKVRTILASQ